MTRSDISDLEKVNEGDFILLVIEVEEESIRIHFQCNRYAGTILFQREIRNQNNYKKS